jgi:hypothetical protein
MATTNNNGEFSISISSSLENIQTTLKISAPGYETITVIPFKGNGNIKDTLGIIFLNPQNKVTEQDKTKASQLNKDQIELLNQDKKDLKYFAQERFNKEIDNLKSKVIPMVIGLISQFGITKATELIKQDPQTVADKISSDSFCPDQSQLNILIGKKNKLTKQLNNTLNLINSTTTALGISEGIILALDISLTAAEAIPSISNPSPPGVLKKLDKTLNTLKATNSGLLGILVLLKQILVQVINLLSLLDQLVGKCTPQNDTSNETLSKELNALTQQQSNQTSPVVTNVNGFEMNIEIENTTNPLKRRRAIATNKQNIVMLKGEWSFSSVDQILIDELVFYIQQNNLKAD